MSNPLDEFLAGMAGHFDQWHDGSSYPLEWIAQMSDGERERLGELLRQRLANGGGWRDAEALGCLAGDEALAAYLDHPRGEVRRYAWRRTRGVPEREVLLALDGVRAMENLDETIRLAVATNTPQVRDAMLRQVREHTDPVVRIHLAAALWHVCGQANEVFDWEQRDFYLQFGDGDRAERAAAEERLRKAMESGPEGTPGATH